MKTHTKALIGAGVVAALTVEGVLSNSEAKVRLILRPDQQEKFDKLIAERKAKQAQFKDD